MAWDLLYIESNINEGGHTVKLSKAQRDALDKIRNHEILTPDQAYHYHVFSPPEDWTQKYESGNSHTWYASRVYGRFNTATLKSLEKKGLIKVHRFGGVHMDDEIEIL